MAIKGKKAIGQLTRISTPRSAARISTPRSAASYSKALMSKPKSKMTKRAAGLKRKITSAPGKIGRGVRKATGRKPRYYGKG